MFVTQKMILLDVLVLEKDVEIVSELIVESGYFEPAFNSQIAQSTDGNWANENILDRKKVLTDFQHYAEILKDFFQPYHSNYILNPDVLSNKIAIPNIGDMLRKYDAQKKQFQDQFQKLRKKKEDLAIKIAGFNIHAKSQQKISSSDTAYGMDLLLGFVSVDNLELLSQECSRCKIELQVENHVNDSVVVFISVPTEEYVFFKDFLARIGFIRYELPPEFFGDGISSILELSFNYTVLCNKEDILDKDIVRATPDILVYLTQILYSLQLYTKITEVKQSMKHAGHFALLSGWIVAEKFRDFKKKLTKICDKQYELIATDTDEFQVQTDIPTGLSNPQFLKPFEELVTIFGVPDYKEIDPTPFFAVLYTLMYGAMFGDVGQGALLFLFGITGIMIQKKSSLGMIYGLMVWVGMSSIFFGLLYGSYFGYESSSYSWVPRPLWISPMENITTLLSITTLFGVGVISFSFVLGIINYVRMKDWRSLVFSHKGILAFVLYMVVLTIGYYLFKSTEIPKLMWVSFGILTIFLGLERVWEAFLYGHGDIKDWWMGFFDMFEFFLSIVTNTLSFIRIGAFALTHAALMMAVFTLQELAGNDTLMAYVIVVLGNVFVVAIEGFSVGIQTLRLEYYEFFMRFFHGTGRKFKPIVYKKRI